MMNALHRHILVTGADGQLGQALRYCVAESADKWIFAGRSGLDITDREAVRRLLTERRIDTVVNCAAWTDVERAEAEPEAADRLNHLAVGELAAAAAERDAELIHISTDYVFGGEGCRPLREEDPTGPLNVYGRTKLLGEQAVATSGVRSLVIRTGWLYSLRGRNFLTTMLRLQGERDRLRVVDDQRGTPTCADDLACAIVRILSQRNIEGCDGLYHFAAEGEASWYDFAAEIARLSGCRCDIRPCTSEEYPTRARRPRYSVLDKHKIRNTFGLTIPHWRDALAACMSHIERT